VLAHLQIRDFALIDRVELEFGGGLTVVTGETGAGKSIIVDALLLVTGGRAASDVVRHGAERAEISATFEVSNESAARAWLKDQSIDCDDECVLRRSISADGRSRGYVNGQAVSLQALRSLGEILVDIHGQHEFQSLGRPAVQRSVLDAHAGHDALVVQVAEAYALVAELTERAETLQAMAANRASQLELLRYQVRELDALALVAGEVEELQSEQRRLANRGRLGEGLSQVLDQLYDSDSGSAYALVSRSQTLVRNLSTLDGQLAPAEALLTEAGVSLREAADIVRHAFAELDVDPARQDWVERRLATVEELARKHKVTPAEVAATRDRLAAELAALESSETQLGQLQTQLAQASARYTEAAAALTRSRRRTAKALSTTVSALMHALGMSGGRFEVKVEATEPPAVRREGADDIEFAVTANPGQPLKALSRVASGGELSRISLAIQVAAASKVAIPCMVFDEIDAGVGGAVAEIVGRQLHELGRRVQVLCVTHLPQVASQGHAHLRVSKITDGKLTRTVASALGTAERIEELARMLGGVEITTRARDHAREMLRLAAQTMQSG
jgi:DNA repair protein RecN (Recombination protein N)